MNRGRLVRLQEAARQAAVEIALSIQPSLDFSELSLIAASIADSSGLTTQLERIVYEDALIRQLASLAPFRLQ